VDLTWNNALLHTLTGVLESMCFMMPTPASMMPRLSSVPVDVSRVHVTFSGPSAGVLELTLPPALMAAVTISMLGDEGPHPRETQEQAVCELANITCGNLLPFIAGEEAIFNLGSPTFVVNSTPLEDADASTAIRLDDGLIEARVKIFPASAETTA
jgi:CheY-specific phosphatase CheX